MVSKTVDSGHRKISVVGLGYVGTVLAMFLCEKGAEVYGVEKQQEIVAKINQGLSPIKETLIPELVEKYVSEGKLVASTDMSVIANTDTVLVTVGTPLGEDYSPDFRAIKEVSEEIAKYLHRGHLIIYKSTVTPGTIEETVLPILEKDSCLKSGKDFMLAFCPERLGEGSKMNDFTGYALEEIRKIPIIVGGITPQSTEVAVEFWQSLGIKTISVSSPKVAEMAKLADNWWIDLNIALANELALLCEKIGIDAYEVIKAANTLPKNEYNVNILLPGCGVGGSCLTKDPWFVHHMGQTYGIELRTCQISREINDEMPKHMYDLVTKALESCGKRVSEANISLLGLAFKQSTSDTRNTPAIPLLHLLLQNGARVKVFDPWVNPQEARRLTGDHAVNTLKEALKDSDCLVLVNAQPEFRRISFSEIKSLVASPCAVVDGRRAFNPEEVTSAGFMYWAVGLGEKSI